MLTEFISIFIAALALFVSVWAVIWTRKNDIRSVKPHVEIYKHFWGDKNELQLANIGLGPAIIEKFDYFVDGKIMANVHEALGYAGIDDKNILAARTFGPGYTLANNSNQKLIWIDSKELGESDILSEKVADLQTALKKISIKIIYKSMHEELETCSWEYDRYA